MVHLDFKATSNMAEYEALLFGLSTTLSLGVRQLLMKGDSQLIVNQVKGDCSCNNPQLAAYLLHARKLKKDFEVLDLQHIPHAENAVVDDLSAKASTSTPVLDGVLERRLWQATAWAANPSEGGKISTSKLAVLAVLLPWSPPRVVSITGDSVHSDVQDPEAQAGPDIWITEIWTYLKGNILPDDMTSADQIARLAKRYTLVEGDLYRCGANGVLMRCITREEGCELLAEVHRGECGNHASSHTLVGKAFWHRFDWPTALQDAVELVDLQGVSIPRQANPHAGTDITNDPTLMALRCVGAGHRGAISPCRWRMMIPVCRHQVHQVAGSNPSGQNQQAICSEVHQVHHIHIWGSQTGS
jgi:hypothetical protein